MVETRRSSSTNKRALPAAQTSPSPPNKRSKAAEASSSSSDVPMAPPPAPETVKSGSESRDPELQSSDPQNSDAAKAADADKSADADVDADALVSPPTPGEAAVDADKSKAVVVYNGRMKKRLSPKMGRASSKTPWARLISQYPQNRHMNMCGPVFTVGHRQCDLNLKESDVSKILCRLRRSEEGGPGAVIEIIGSKGFVEVNGNIHQKDSVIMIRGGDEVVFSPSSKHSYIFQQLTDDNLAAPGIPSPVSILEAQGAPLKTMHVETRSGDPSAVAGASILASLSNHRKESILPPPAKTGEDVQNTDMSTNPSGCDGSDDRMPDVDMKDTTSSNDAVGVSARGKTVVPPSEAAIENPNLDSPGLDACMDTEFGKIPATHEIRPLLQMLANSPAPDFDISGSISRILDEQREIRDLLKEADRPIVMISTKRQAFKDNLKEGILSPENIEVSFESFPYYLSDTTKNVLIASTYIHLKCNKFAKYASDLPTMCPRILLSGPAGSEIYQETLAKALAKHFGAKLLIVDSLILPGGSTPKEADPVKESSRPERASALAKRASQTALLHHKRPTSSVEADIMGGSTVSSQALPKPEASTASSKNYTFKKGDRVRYVGTPGTSHLQPTLRGPTVGFRGRVLLPFEDNDYSKIGVRFDKPIPEGNNLGGFCEEDHGFFCTASSLKLDSEDPENVLIDWSEKTNQNLCAWRGITCDHDSVHVVSLNLSGSSLGGSISPSIGRLKNLTHLDLSNNNLMGPIPTTLSELSSLESLSLFSNQLTGSIPTQLGSLTGLRVLRIGDNWLTGQIPDSFGGLVNIVNLALASCSLTGPIPPQLGRLSKLESLILQENQLEGPIPVELGNCSSLTLFTAALNNLNGSIPAELGRLRNLQLLNLANNSLSGDIPSELGELSQLDYLNLLGNKLEGPIPRSISKLGSLQNLDLSMNMLSGGIPEEFGDMGQLVYIVLSNNNISGTIPGNMCTNNTNLESLVLSGIQLSGKIPGGLSRCQSLKQLDLSNNTLNGSIPEDLFQMVELSHLYLHNNSLVGSISPSISNLSNLQELALYHNNFQGNLPGEIGLLGKLELLYLYDNQLSGEIPSEIGNSSSLKYVDFFGNRFTGEIPTTIGSLKDLNFLHLRQNEFVGQIPASLGNCNQLTILDLADNNLSGGIPESFGFLQALEQLMLYNNSLEGNLPGSLINLANLTRINFSKNRFNGSISALCSSRKFLSFDVTNNAFDGEIPPQLGNSINLERLRLGNNKFSGKIPLTLGKIRELSLLDLSENSITGEIPPQVLLCKKLTHIDLNKNLLLGPVPMWLGSLPQLGELKLSSNQFFGSLPRELFNCSKLLVLALDDNLLNGSIPEEVGNLATLNVLNLVRNQFSGPIPPSVSKLSKLYELQLSHNSLNGEIPAEIGQLQNLQSILDLSYNNLTGRIPPSIGKLSKLEELDLSHNQLAGEVPSQVGEMVSLGKLDLSYNSLQGKLSKQFSDWPAKVFEGNAHLCGGPLDSCSAPVANRQSTLSEPALVAISVLSTLSAIALLIVVILLFLKHKQEFLRKVGEVNFTHSSGTSQAQRRLLFQHGTAKWDLKWEDIMEATNNLSDEFIIGSGGSGTIYKAELHNGTTIAVKKISCKDDLLSNKSFTTEIKTLGRIRHRHLVKLMGYCCNKGSGSNLLIYDYMENGSLWDWLHKQPANVKKTRSLDWEARLRIAVGLAQGVEYLHHDCVPKIIHRDIKSSNVLLDSNMEAHLGDFGLAKALVESCDSNTESSLWFAGSYGYIAPEYAYSLKATEKCDVYSLGIVLMELVTGKMPTDDTFGVDMDMVRWVETHIEMAGSPREDLISEQLKPLFPVEECAAYQVLEIALQCTKTSPQERPTSRIVCDLLLQVFNKKTVNFDKINVDSYT